MGYGDTTSWILFIVFSQYVNKKDTVEAAANGRNPAYLEQISLPPNELVNDDGEVFAENVKKNSCQVRAAIQASSGNL